MNYRRTELNAVDDIHSIEDEYHPVLVKNKNRLHSWKNHIINPWDDYPVAASREFNNRQFWKNQIKAWNDQHFTKNG